MAAAVQPDFDVLVGQLEIYTSAPRIRRYLVRMGHRSEKALDMYIWNAQVGESFHIAIQACEVSLRNRINYALIVKFRQDWWKHNEFLKIIDYERQKDMDLAKRRISNLNKLLCTDQLVANLSFGFWVGIMAGSYNPVLWGEHLRTAFPDIPLQITRRDVHARIRGIAELRNRISHHEPIFERNLSKDYADIIEFLRWMSPVKSKWIAAACRVPTLIRLKPK